MEISISLRAASEEINYNQRNMSNEYEFEGPKFCLFCHGKNSSCKKRSSSSSLKRPLSEVEDIDGIVEVSETSLTMLPESILLRIFDFIDHQELLIVRCLSSQLKRIAEDRQLWRYINLSCKRIFENHFIFKLPRQIREKVKNLNLMWAHVSVHSFNVMKRLFVNMEILLMQYCKFSLQFKGGLKSFDITDLTKPLPSKMRILDLRNVHGRWFDDSTIISTWPKIEAMAFSQTMPLDWMARLSLVSLPQLRVLCIENNPSLSDGFVAAMIQRSPNLQSINLHGSMYIKGEFLEQVAKCNPKLETLDVSGTKVEGHYMRGIDWSKSQIKSLNISFCCKILEADLADVLPKFKALEQLRCSFTGWGRALSNNVLSKMAAENPIIESLDIQSTFNLSVSALAKLCRSSTRLKNLRIGTLLKTTEDVDDIVRSIPNIENLSLQLGDAMFSAAYLFESLVGCKSLEALFTYNATFEFCSIELLRESLYKLFDSCRHLKHFFTGGYAHHVKLKVDELIDGVSQELGVTVNIVKPTRMIPLPDVCFDRYLCNDLTKTKFAKNLKSSIQKTVNCQSFYKAGLQKLDDYQFSLMRS